MLVGQVGDEFGFSLNPIKAVKSVAKVAAKTITVPTKYVAKGVTTGAKGVAKGAKVAGKAIYQAHAIPTKWLAIKPTMWLAEKATAPVRSRIHTLVNRRAAKLAWDRRKSKTPTPAEHNEARTWTRNRLLKMTPIVPLAPVLAAFAGAPSHILMGHFDGPSMGQLGVAPAVVAAAVPVMLAAAAAILQQLSKSGEAPANPEQGAGPDPSLPANAEAAAQQMQAAAAQAAAAEDAGGGGGSEDAGAGEDAAAGGGGGGGGGGGKMMKLPGGMKVQKGNLMLYGGLAIGAVVLIMVMKKKQS